MKFTLSWLKEHLETDRSLDEICATLSMIGLEVEGGEGDVEGVGGRAHREEETAGGHVFVDLDRDGFLLLGDFDVAQVLSHCFVGGLLLPVPGFAAV